jgi:3-oxoacyl-[acyl-carrier-protein] synthase II
MRSGGDFLRSGDPQHLRRFLAGSVLDQALEGMPIAGPRLTTCAACSSGLSSIALAATLIRTGQIDVAICGGYDPVSEYAYAGFESLRLIAKNLPRPFAADRNGMKIGEGYGIVVLERAELAVKRGAAIKAFLAGIGETSDAFHLTQPHPDGLGATAAIRRALEEAGIDPSCVDMISAHGTATPNNDAAEYAALSAALGSSLSMIPIVAFKSHLGHTLGGAGAVELVLSVLSRLNDRVPATANTKTIDPEFKGLNLVQGQPNSQKVRTTLNLSLGFGGANTCAVLSDQGDRHREVANSEDNEPVITGMGVVLPGIIGRESFYKFMTESNGKRALSSGAIPEESFAHLLNARRTRRMSEYSKLTLAAVQDACHDAGVHDNAEWLDSSAAVLGTMNGASPFCEMYYGQIIREGLGAANPVLFAEGVPNAAAAHLSMMLGIRGGCQTLIGSRTSGLNALMIGSLRIREGNGSRIVVAAAEEFASVIDDAYRGCALARSDGSGDGIGPTASAAVSFVVESRRSAAARGARILASIGGCAWCSSDGFRTSRIVVENLGKPRHVVCPYGKSKGDHALMRELKKQPETEVWSIADRVPETFSVGPLIALAGVMVRPLAPSTTPQWSESVGVLASEFNGSSCGLGVKFPPAAANGPFQNDG